MAALTHFMQQPVERGDLSRDLLVGIPLELDGELVHPTFDLVARELFRKYELDGHARDISRTETPGQEVGWPRIRVRRRIVREFSTASLIADPLLAKLEKQSVERRNRPVFFLFTTRFISIRQGDRDLAFLE